MIWNSVDAHTKDLETEHQNVNLDLCSKLLNEIVMNVDIKLHEETKYNSHTFALLSDFKFLDDLTLFQSVGKELKSIYLIRPKLFLKVL